jgi:hypothetical protein
VVRAFRLGFTSPDSGGLSITRHPVRSIGRSAASESKERKKSKESKVGGKKVHRVG